ncbi:hypothetical protein BCR34DRAFT_584882 [Clohesyomyces aquaticus]|uniref:Aminoglycoside phosphotransferase domain-containing protein n=1 Tax=Clohesyomyces aquaticus TaxID=1231657 RepID=A0A1Y1ZZM4_9PLEO|nr:hypothetical protein BCR34DRAFT_584882 [Clohesyomyces aquaticus]
MFEPIVDVSRDPSTKFPRDGLSFNIASMPQETLIAHGKAAPVLHSLGGVQIVRLSHNLVLKSGTGVLASEGETMSYVVTACPEAHIVMDYVDSRSLDSCSDQLSQQAQKEFVTQVAAMVSFTGEYLALCAGPFPTNAVFEKWTNWKLALSKHPKQAAADVPEISYRPFVLTNGDLSPRNLMLDADNQLWLTDWGCAGFYPPIFEAATLKNQVQFRVSRDYCFHLLQQHRRDCAA